MKTLVRREKNVQNSHTINIRKRNIFITIHSYSIFKALCVVSVNCLEAEKVISVALPGSLGMLQGLPPTLFLPIYAFNAFISFNLSCKSEFPSFLIFGIYLVYHYGLLELLKLPKCSFRLGCFLGFYLQVQSVLQGILVVVQSSALTNTISFYL